MPSEENLFEVECRDATVIVTPTGDLSEFQFNELTRQANEGFERLEKTEKVRNAVLDFRHTDYFGSTALGLFVQLWLRICRRGGRMALCNLSEREREIISITHLDSTWPLCEDLETALRTVEEENHRPAEPEPQALTPDDTDERG